MEEEVLLGEMWKDLDVPCSPQIFSDNLFDTTLSIPPTSYSLPLLSSSSPPSPSIASPLNLSTVTNTTQNSNSTKKRKIPTIEENDNASFSCSWHEYAHGPQTYPILDPLSLERNTDLDVHTQIKNPNSFYSQRQGAWIIYRQNQFKVMCLLKGVNLNSASVNDKGVPKPIEGFYAKIYGVKQVGGVVGDGMRTGLHHAGKKRVKSDKHEIEITPFSKGKLLFGNLQFEKSNAVKNPQHQTEFFHIVLILYAKSNNTMYPVLSKISPKIIVRALNPGFYKDEETAENTNTRAFAFVNPSFTNSPEKSWDSPSSGNNSPTNSDQSSPSPSNSQFASPLPTPPLPSPSPPPESNSILSSLDTSSYFDSLMTPLLTSVSQPDIYEESFLTGQKIESVHGGKDKETGWAQNGDSVYHFGNVGINTSVPIEALTVHGNILATGTVMKPSDRRIKSQIESVDNKEQLERVRQLKIYDYIVHEHPERGVIAQELAKVMPEAVHGVGDVNFTSVTIPNLLVVNERSLLYENIGATKQIDMNLQSEKANVENLHLKVEEIQENSTQDNIEIKGTLHSVVDSLFREEQKQKTVYSGLEEEFVNFQFSVFRMGPARSLFILGFFATWFWAIGCLFVFSNVRHRKVLGTLSLILMMFTWEWVQPESEQVFAIFSMVQGIISFFGFIFACIVLRLNYSRLKRQFLNYPSRPYPVSLWGRLRHSVAVCLCY